MHALKPHQSAIWVNFAPVALQHNNSMECLTSTLASCVACDLPGSLRKPFTRYNRNTSATRTGQLPKHPAPFGVALNARRSLKQPRAVFTTDSHPAEAHSKTDSLWDSFCEHAAGEWEGATATFSADGTPHELPSQYVPQEFTDWNVTLYDWQSQCSMQPQATGIKCLLKRLMPTVGCEADAQSFNEDKRQLFESTTPMTEGHQAVLSNGSYTTTSSLQLTNQTSLRFEHCLATAEQRRIRLVQHVTASSASGPWKLSTVEVHNEKYDAPYNGGASLSGCGGGMSNFAESAKLDIQQLQQERKITSSRCYNVSEDGKLQLQDLPHQICSSSLAGITCLPLNTYSIVQSDQHGGLLIEAGVLQKDNCLLVAQQRFVDGRCTVMTIGSKTSA